MGIYCNCGRLITGIDQIRIDSNTYFYCKRCDLYFNSSLQNVSEEEVKQSKKQEQDEFPFINSESLHKTVTENFTEVRSFYYYPPKETIKGDEMKKKFYDHVISIKIDPDYALRVFFPRLDRTIKKDINLVICVIPSHEKGLEMTPTRLLAKELCNNKRIDGTTCIIRKYTIQKKHGGGGRNLIDEMNSLIIENEQIIKGKIIVLFDDIITTGTSMEACIQLLRQAGAKKVFGLAIAQTSSY
jgi:phosphoribosylpyrophosphate synthetase